jgi:hypothetical protein
MGFSLKRIAPDAAPPKVEKDAPTKPAESCSACQSRSTLGSPDVKTATLTVLVLLFSAIGLIAFLFIVWKMLSWNMKNRGSYSGYVRNLPQAVRTRYRSNSNGASIPPWGTPDVRYYR